MNERATIRRLDRRGLTETEIAQRFGRSRTWLATRRATLDLLKSPKPAASRGDFAPVEFLPLSSPAEEAKNLLPLLSRTSAVETPETIRQLICVSDHDFEFLKQYFDATDAKRIAEYRGRVLTAFEKLVGEREHHL